MLIGTLKIEGGTIENNKAGGNGGGLSNSGGVVKITGCSIKSNSAANGGGIFDQTSGGSAAP